MIKVSPLGAIAITILTARWNDSQDNKRKESIRGLLQSRNFQLKRQAMENLSNLADEQLRSCKFIWSGTVPIKTEFLLTAIATAAMNNLDKGKRSSFTKELFDKAFEEATNYFIEAFKAGHFEKLPMPEFGYELPIGTQRRVHISKRNNKPNTLAQSLLGYDWVKRQLDGIC